MTEQEKIEMLMRPRYEVVLDYPESLYDIGYIIHEAENIEGATFFKTTVHKYRHIFRPMEWWERRSKKDLPKYVKDEKGVYRVQEWHTGLAPKCTVYINPKIHQGYVDDCTRSPLYSDMIPATESEYLAYIQSPTPAQ